MNGIKTAPVETDNKKRFKTEKLKRELTKERKVEGGVKGDISSDCEVQIGTQRNTKPSC